MSGHTEPEAVELPEPNPPLGEDRPRRYTDPAPGTAGLSPDPDAPGRSVDAEDLAPLDTIEPNEPA